MNILKKILLILSLVACCSFSADNEQKVYLCMGKYSSCYHIDRKCEGLVNCSTDIKTVSLKEAEKMGRRPCGYCCKK